MTRKITIQPRFCTLGRVVSKAVFRPPCDSSHCRLIFLLSRMALEQPPVALHTQVPSPHTGDLRSSALFARHTAAPQTLNSLASGRWGTKQGAEGEPGFLYLSGDRQFPGWVRAQGFLGTLLSLSLWWTPVPYAFCAQLLGAKGPKAHSTKADRAFIKLKPNKV